MRLAARLRREIAEGKLAPGNPTPSITGLSPSSATAGGSAFALTVDGGAFVDGAQVRWNGAILSTTYVSPTRLTAQVPATDIATLTYPGGSTADEETALLKAAATAFPSITTVRVREALDAVLATAC